MMPLGSCDAIVSTSTSYDKKKNVSPQLECNGLTKAVVTLIMLVVSDDFDT